MPGGCPPDCPPGTFTALGAMAGALLGGFGGGGGGLLLSAGSGGAGLPSVPVFSVAGATAGAEIGGGLGLAVDAGVMALKGESAELGAAISQVMGAAANTVVNRREFGRYCEDCKERGDTGSKNSKGDFTFSELITRAKEFFGIQ